MRVFEIRVLGRLFGPKSKEVTGGWIKLHNGGSIIIRMIKSMDHLCGLVVRVLDYRSGSPGSIPGTTRFSGKKKKKKTCSGSGMGCTQPREYN
jgi:hypothetical protein